MSKTKQVKEPKRLKRFTISLQRKTIVKSSTNKTMSTAESNSSSNNSLNVTPPVNESFSAKILATLKSFKLFKLITIVCIFYVLGVASSDRCLFALAAPVSSNHHLAKNQTNYLLNSNKLPARKAEKFSVVKPTATTTTPKADEYDYYEEETNDETNKENVSYEKTVDEVSNKKGAQQTQEEQVERDEDYQEEYEAAEESVDSSKDPNRIVLVEESRKEETTSTPRTTQTTPNKAETSSQKAFTKKVEKSTKEADEDYDYGEEDYYILSNRYFQMGKHKKGKTSTTTVASTQTSSTRSKETVSSTKKTSTKSSFSSSSSTSPTISSNPSEELVIELEQTRPMSTKLAPNSVEKTSTKESIVKSSPANVVHFSKSRAKPDKLEAVELSGAIVSTSTDATLSITSVNSTSSTNKTANEEEYYLEDEYYEDEYSEDYKEDERNVATSKKTDESTRAKDSSSSSSKVEKEGGEDEYKDTEEYYYDEDEEENQQTDTTEDANRPPNDNNKSPSDVEVDETFDDEYDANVEQTSTKSNKAIGLVPELKLNKDVENKKTNRVDETPSFTAKSSTLTSPSSTSSDSQSATTLSTSASTTTNANKKIIDRINQNKEEINLAENIDNYFSEENLDSEQANGEDDDVEIDEYDQMGKNFELEVDEENNQSEDLIQKSKIGDTSIINTTSILRYLTLKELLKSPALLAGVFGGLLVGVITASLLLFFIIYKMRRRKYDDNTYIINGTLKGSNFHYGNSRAYGHASKHVTLLSSSSISPTANLSAGSSASATTGLLNGHTMNNSRILKYTNANNTLRKASSVLSSDSSSSPNHESSLNYAYIKAPTKEFYA